MRNTKDKQKNQHWRTEQIDHWFARPFTTSGQEIQPVLLLQPCSPQGVHLNEDDPDHLCELTTDAAYTPGLAAWWFSTPASDLMKSS